MKIYRYSRINKIYYISIMIAVLVGIALLVNFLFKNEQYTFFFVPFMLILLELEKFYVPYISLDENLLQKREFLIKRKINLQDITNIKEVFGDIYVSDEKKTIKIDKDQISKADKNKILDHLSERTDFKLA